MILSSLLSGALSDMSAQRGSLLSPPPLPSHPPPGRTQTEGRVAESRRDGEIRKENLSGRKNAPRAKTFPFSPFTAQLQNRAPARTELARARSVSWDPRRHGRALSLGVAGLRRGAGTILVRLLPFLRPAQQAHVSVLAFIRPGAKFSGVPEYPPSPHPAPFLAALVQQPELPSEKFDYHVFGAPSLLKDLPRPMLIVRYPLVVAEPLSSGISSPPLPPGPPGSCRGRSPRFAR